MHIDPKGTIANQRTIKLRDFIRRAGGSSWPVQYLKGKLKISLKEANIVLSELITLGYIELDFEQLNIKYWKVTLAGSSFGLASAAKPIKRSTADRKLKEFMDRVYEVNSNEYYLFKVTKVIVFGSYLSKDEKINDIDIWVSLESKEKNLDRHLRNCDRRTNDAIDDGKYFSNFVEQIGWPEIEVIKYLKSRSRAISLHNNDPIIKRVKRKKIIFTENI